MGKTADLAEQIQILATGLAVQARQAGLDAVAAHLEAAAREAQGAKGKSAGLPRPRRP